jgi:hypothetical protein
MNKNVIYLLSEATRATIEGDELKAMKLTAEALTLMSSGVVSKTKEVVTSTTKKVVEVTHNPKAKTFKGKRNYQMLNAQVWEQVFTQISNGATVYEVAKKFGIPYQTVYGRLRRATQPNAKETTNA